MGQQLDRNAHPVVTTIVERAYKGSKPGSRSDNHSVALVVEGGIMRGVVSAGMLLGLEALGLRNAFDAVYGTSSGAANAAYFLSAQSGVGASIYYEYPRHFGSIVRMSQLLKGKPVIDLRNLFHEAIFDYFPLDFEELVRSSIGLRVLASVISQQGKEDAKTTELRCLTCFRDRQDLLRALHASAQLPVIGGRAVEYKGMNLLDGGIVEEVPVHTAIADNHSHILVLLTLPEGAAKHKLAQWLERMYVLPRLEKIDASLAKVLATRHKRYEATRQLLRTNQHNWHGPPYITYIALPPAGPRVNAFESRRNKLIEGIEGGVHATLHTFHAVPYVIRDLITVLDRNGRLGSPVLPPRTDLLPQKDTRSERR